MFCFLFFSFLGSGPMRTNGQCFHIHIKKLSSSFFFFLYWILYHIPPSQPQFLALILDLGQYPSLSPASRSKHQRPYWDTKGNADSQTLLSILFSLTLYILFHESDFVPGTRDLLHETVSEIFESSQSTLQSLVSRQTDARRRRQVANLQWQVQTLQHGNW